MKEHNHDTNCSHEEVVSDLVEQANKKVLQSAEEARKMRNKKKAAKNKALKNAKSKYERRLAKKL